VDPVKTECESLQDLKAILDKAREWEIQLLVIGGWAVNAYVGAYRYTKDIDLVMKAVDRGSLKALLKQHDYDVEDIKFYIAGQKERKDIQVKIHISIGDIVDTSRGYPLRYSIDENAYRNAPLLPIRGRYPQCREYELDAPIFPINNLFITKLLPVGRERDVVDFVSLILRRGKALDVDFIAKEVVKNNLLDAIESRIEDTAHDVESGDLEKVWMDYTGQRISRKDLNEIRLRFLRQLVTRLRQLRGVESKEQLKEEKIG